MNRLVGTTDVEDALVRLDTLTKEEGLMMAARTLEVSHRVDVNVTATKELTNRVDHKVTTIEEVVHNVDGNVKETRELTQSIHNDVKVTRHGAQLSISSYT